jgi:5-methylcytosine-specific restriction endonuclease McrA
MDHEIYNHENLSECELCVEHYKKVGGPTLKELEEASDWFQKNVASGWHEIQRIMSTQEWADESWKELPHGANATIYHICKKHKKGPCQPCIKANLEYGKEYRSREDVKKRRKEYNRTNRNKNNKTRFKKLENTPEYSFYSANTVLAKYGELCHLCNEKIDLDAPRKTGEAGWEKSLHIDHVIPLSKGGSDTLKNVRPSHGQCNLMKSNKV